MPKKHPRYNCPMLTFEKLGREIGDILGLPTCTPRYGKAYDIAKAVIKSLTEALRRGEEVHIRGIGIFRLRHLKPKKHYSPFFFGRNTKTPAHEMRILPARNYVYFKPTKSILKVLNESQPSV